MGMRGVFWLMTKLYRRRILPQRSFWTKRDAGSKFGHIACLKMGLRVDWSLDLTFFGSKMLRVW